MRFYAWCAVGIAWRQSAVEFPPASTVYGIFVRWVRVEGVAAHPRRVARPAAGPCRADRCPTAAVIDSQTMPAAGTPAAVSSRVGRRETDERGQAPHRGGCLRAAVRRAGTAASIQDRDAAHRLLAALRELLPASGWSGPRWLPRAAAGLGGKVYSPFGLRSSNGSPAAPDSTCGPEFGWWSARSAGSSSTVVAGVPTRPDPTTTRPSSTSP